MSKKVEVLIVEEDTTQSASLQHILEQHDYRVSVEHNGKLALDAVRENPPEIVISAVMLPEMDGYELCREIKSDERLKNIPVILLTSLSDPADIIRGMECGADNFITKPYDEKLLMSRLEYILLNRELRSDSSAEVGVEFVFNGEKHSITPERGQMVDLLISTYETAVQKNIELELVQTELNRLNEQFKEKIEESSREITARRLAETSLREQETFLREVIDANPNPVFVKDRKGRFTLVNEATATLYDTTMTEIIGKTDRELNAKEEEIERISRFEKEVIETAKKIHVPEEEFTDRKTGEKNWFQMVRTPLVKTNGEVSQILGVGTDITERKRAEDKLRRRELELSDYFENATIGLHWVGGDGIIKWANKAEMELLGYTPEEYIGHHISEFHADQNVINNILQRLTGDEALHDHEARMRCKDGTFKDVLINSNVFRENGEFVHTRCFTRDVTERKRAQNELRKANEKLEKRVAERTAEFEKANKKLEISYTQLAEAQTMTHLGSWSLDIATNKIEWSDELYRIYGFEPQAFEPNHKTSIKVIYPDDRKLAVSIVQKSIKEGKSFNFVQRIMRPDKSMRFIECLGEAIFDKPGKIVKMIGTAQDITDRKQAEDKLKEKEEQLTEAQRTAQIGSWAVDMATGTSTWSDELFRIFGYEPDEIVPSYEVYSALIHPDDCAFVIEENERMERERISIRNEYRILCADGTIRYLDANSAVTCDEAGNIVKISGTVQDITRRKLAEEKLRENEQLVRAVFDVSRDGIVIEDDSVIAYINDSYAKLLGYEESENLIGKNISEFLPPEEAERLTEYGQRRFRGEEAPSIYEFKGKRKDGTLIDVEGAVSTSIIGGKRYIMTAIRDIADRKQAEKEIKNSERRYRALITASAQVVWLADAAGRADFTTAGWQELTGQSIEATRGWGWLDALHPKSKKRSERLWKQAVKNKTVYDDEQTVRTRDGSYRIFQARGVPIFGDDKKVKEWVGTLTDITDRKRAEEALQAGERRYRELVEMLPIAVYTCDMLGAIENYNQSAVEMWGRAPQKMDLTDIFCGSYKIYDTDGVYMPHDECPMAQVLRTGKPVSNEEIVVERSDGTRRTAMVNAVPRRDEQGKMTGAINCLVDITERDLAEAALARSENELRTLFSAMSDVIIELDADGRYIKIAPTDPALFYKPSEDIIGKTVHDIFPAEVADMFLNFIKKALASEQAVNVEYSLPINGNETWFYATSTQMTENSVLWVARDVTKSKKAEETLLRETALNELLRTIAIAANEAADIEDAARICIDKVCDLTKWQLGHLILLADDSSGDLVSTNLWHVCDREKFEKFCSESEALRWNKGSGFPGRILETGEAMWVTDIAAEKDFNRKQSVKEAGIKSAIAFPIVVQAKVMGVLEFFSVSEEERNEKFMQVLMSVGNQLGQVIERKRALEELQNNLSFLTSTFEATADGILVVDLHNEMLTFNERFVEMWRIPENLVKEKDTAQMMAHISEQFKDLENFKKNLERLMRQPEIRDFSVLELKDEKRYERLSLPRTVDGKVVGRVLSFRDITERKEIEEKLKLSEEHLRQSQKMEAIGTLTGGVAHDFNNLLTAILGNVQLAQRKLSPDDPIRLRLNEVTAAGNRAADLTRQLLAFSRRQHLMRRTIDLNQTIPGIITLLERIIGEDVEMSVKYRVNLPAVFADAAQIEQVIMNLAVNARDAMPTGGKLTISTDFIELDENYCRQYPYVVPGKFVQISVSDSGIGMDEETRARVFEPYFTTKEVGKGTGLGLSISYGIIKQHDGHINLYSEPGLGTTFRVYLPVDEKPVEEKNQTIAPSFAGGSETILVAEDEDPLRNMAKDVLEDLGYTVLTAKDGEEAVEIFGAHRGSIDLFLSDVIMPRMGGSEAYEKIREMEGGKIPLIFMTGYSSETVQSRFVHPKITAEELGATVIQKPYSLNELGRIVREVLDKNLKP